ncbi:hypothetical protein SPV1_04683 [Mariprofundus ferrooxydans PV-1]|jgi:hypothetical protein|uniref:Uncharacterized protein n=1 Tax=Mariprofundus ferrooxydans PV-1 TaxID=314345 RepID=Q0F354_9PROT|nr:hypothetical protein SPV1_04683 [Mariprofundus ferrooxydans PV-1]
MDDEFQLVRSPLCEESTSDGETAKVEIYRGADDKS